MSEKVECLYCLGEGTVKRRYGTVEAGPAKRVKIRECPVCDGSGEVPPEVLDYE
jgi:DnaJ-class molecular chaperone